MAKRIKTTAKASKISPPYPMVYVEWYDACSEDAWQSADEAIAHRTEDWLVKSVGFLIKEDKELIQLCGSAGFTDVCMTLKIPRGMVKKMVDLKF